MRKQTATLDISRFPELLSVVEEVRSSGHSRVLTRGDEEIAVIVPVAHSRRYQSVVPRARRDIEAMLSSAGAWRGIVDAEQLKADIRASRGSDRPAVDL
jgi:hypothetical protein